MPAWEKELRGKGGKWVSSGGKTDYAVLKDHLPSQAHKALHSFFASGKRLPSRLSVKQNDTPQAVGKALNYVAMGHRAMALVHQRSGRTAVAANYRKKADAIEGVAKSINPTPHNNKTAAAKQALSMWERAGGHLPADLKNAMDKSPDALNTALNYAAMGYRASALKHGSGGRDTLSYSHHRRAVQLERLARAISPKGPSSTSASKKARRVARDNPMGVTRRDIRSSLQDAKLDLSPAARQQLVDEVHAHANRLGMYGIGSGKRLSGDDIAGMFSSLSASQADKLASVIDELRKKGRKL
jgi:hypothetical protein